MQVPEDAWKRRPSFYLKILAGERERRHFQEAMEWALGLMAATPAQTATAGS
jgi:hypothetical protein